MQEWCFLEEQEFLKDFGSSRRNTHPVIVLFGTSLSFLKTFVTFACFNIVESVHLFMYKLKKGQNILKSVSIGMWMYCVLLFYNPIWWFFQYINTYFWTTENLGIKLISHSKTLEWPRNFTIVFKVKESQLIRHFTLNARCDYVIPYFIVFKGGGEIHQLLFFQLTCDSSCDLIW